MGMCARPAPCQEEELVFEETITKEDPTTAQQAKHRPRRMVVCNLVSQDKLHEQKVYKGNLVCWAPSSTGCHLHLFVHRSNHTSMTGRNRSRAKAYHTRQLSRQVIRRISSGVYCTCLQGFILLQRCSVLLVKNTQGNYKLLTASLLGFPSIGVLATDHPNQWLY